MTTISFELTTPIFYANGSGAQIECSHIDLIEPTGKVSSTCCAIEGMIQSSILGMASVLGDDVIAEAKDAAEGVTPPDDGGQQDGDSVLALIMGGGCDMTKLVLHFRELFKTVALMGGEKKMTAARMDDMSHKDFRRMIGVYAANFVMS